MSSLLHSLTNWFESIAAHPPMGLAVVVLCLLATGFGAVLYLDNAYARDGTSSRRDMPAPGILLLPLLAIFFWLTGALITLGLVRLLGGSTTFEAVFCVLVFGSSPKFISWFAYSLRELTWWSVRLWRVFAFTVLLITSASVLLTLHAAAPLAWWRVSLAALPWMGLLCFVGLWEAWEKPSRLSAAVRWRRAVGHDVVVFFVGDHGEEEIATIVEGCDATLARATELLSVSPIKVKVHVFLFPDDDSHRRSIKPDGELHRGYSHGDSISLRYGDWESIRATVAHEFGHVLREQCIHGELYGLLDEGLACYVEQQLVGERHYQVWTSLSVPVRMMSYSYTFYDGLHSKKKPLARPDAYSYACSFASYLIDQHGIEKYKQLCKTAAGDHWKDCGGRLAEACDTVYGTPIEEMESRWHWSREEQRERTVGPVAWSRFGPAAQAALSRTDDEAVSRRHNEIEADHLIIGLLLDRENRAAAIVGALGVSADVLVEEARERLAVLPTSEVGERTTSQQVRRILDLTVDEARRSADGLIGTEHLLRGISRGVGGEAQRILAARGLTITRLRIAGTRLRSTEYDEVEP